VSPRLAECHIVGPIWNAGTRSCDKVFHDPPGIGRRWDKPLISGDLARDWFTLTICCCGSGAIVDGCWSGVDVRGRWEERNRGRETALGEVLYSEAVGKWDSGMQTKARTLFSAGIKDPSQYCYCVCATLLHANSIATPPWPQRKYPGVIVIETTLMSPDGLHSVPEKLYHGGKGPRMRSRMGEKQR
jgi:hypothetical protein